MTTTKEIQNLFHKIIELKENGYEVDIADHHKNYTSYTLSKTNGTAKYEDCIILYNGDTEDNENICVPDEIPAVELLKELEDIVIKIDKVFDKNN